MYVAFYHRCRPRGRRSSSCDRTSGTIGDRPLPGGTRVYEVLGARPVLEARVRDGTRRALLGRFLCSETQDEQGT
ncbi:hypothetical protein DPMN_104402 [Dreissena polymorpha]|uniref:Uncharacterized protein n=1 Tax=Dreissena polymorpha TaxID=45954 RepID=A0A9D4K010_DREPO|nr:hypothetical protein DPMN_104402 [Dreissena polymorpha]